jgi:hypothetical protein
LPTIWNPAPSATFHRAARCLAEHLARLAGVAIDPAVYSKVQPLRAPNSRHPKTGLYKRRLSFEELMGLSVEGIRQLAQRPEPFELPAPARRCEQAESDWRAAVQTVVKETEEKAERRAAVATGAPRLNRLTLDFIREGAPENCRAVRLFSAAANLAEFGCPTLLAHALLTEAALDSGLPPAEVRRQIDCGLKHVGAMPSESPPAPGAPPPSPSAATPRSVQEQLAALWANTLSPNARDTWDAEADRHAAGTNDCPFGANVNGPYGQEGGRR